MFKEVGSTVEDFKYDIEDNGSDFTVVMDAPGIDPDSIDISAAKGILSIRAISIPSNGKYVRQHRVKRSSNIELELPEDVEVEKLSSKLDNGLLSVKLPRKVVRPVVVKTKTPWLKLG